jgi:methylmalonyl-CoA/ethylmalonyl-CoA epimerase
MKVNKIDHICIAVKNLGGARRILGAGLGKSKPDDATSTSLKRSKSPAIGWARSVSS